MTTTAVLQWIKDNLSDDIRKALSQFPDTIFTENDLAGLTCRETGILIQRYAPVRPVMKLEVISSLMRGDYSQRKGEADKRYHGYGFVQIDIASFPDFVRSGDWKIPYKCYLKALGVLEGKKNYLVARYPNMEQSVFKHIVFSAYNAGEGNVRKAIENQLDSDEYTTGDDYGAAVEGFAILYANLGAG